MMPRATRLKQSCLRGQGAFEYVLLLAGILLVAVIAVLILRSNVFPSVNAQIGNNQQAFSNTVCLKTYETDPNSVVGVWHFDEGGGTTLADASGHGNTLSFGDGWGLGHVGPTWVAAGSGLCPSGSCLQFNGASSSVGISNLALSNSYALSLWIKPITSSPANPWGALIAQDGGNAFFYRKDIHYLYSYWANPGGAITADANPLTENSWHHVVLSSSSGTPTFYIDGQPAGTTSGSPAFTARAIGDDSGNEGFNGLIDEVVIYSRPLSPTEVQNDFRCKG